MNDASERLLSQYYEQAATLRLCLLYNQEDYAFAKGGGRIVYLIDANVVHFFLDPEEESDHVTVFGKSQSDNYSSGTALITAEFLFSRGLAGQSDSPAFITHGHAEEVLALVDDIREMITAEPIVDAAEDQLAQDKVEELRDVVDRAAGRKGDGNVDRAWIQAELTRLVPGVAAQVLRGSYSRLQQLRRLYGEDLLRPLSLHSAATTEILQPNPEKVAIWIDRIRKEKLRDKASSAAKSNIQHPPRRNPRSRRAEADSDRIRKDAEAIVQVMLLDTEKSSEQIAYVFVTADQHLFDAYSKWYWNEAELKERGRFLLRHPLQYVPILNVQEMPNGIGSSDVFARASHALDALFANLVNADSAYPHKLSYYRMLARQATVDSRSAMKSYFLSETLAFGDAERQRFERIRTEWHDSFRKGVLLNAELMQRRQRAVFGPLALLLRSRTDLRRALHDSQLATLERIERQHLHFSTRLNMSLMAGQPGHVGSRAPRADLLIRARMPSEPLRVALDRIAEMDRAALANLYEELTRTDDFKRFLFAGCVAFRCAHWEAAFLYAGRALELVSRKDRQSIEWLEVSYLVASATRYALAASREKTGHWRDRVDRARQLLAESIAVGEAIHDEFGQFRARIEGQSFELVMAFRDRLFEEVQPGIQSRSIARDAAGLASSITAKVAARGSEENENDLNDWEALESQAWCNVVSAAVLMGWMCESQWGATEGKVIRIGVESALQVLKDQLATGRLPPVMAAEYLMAQLLCGHLSPQSATAEFEQALPRETVGLMPLDLDKVEIEFFRRMLSESTKARFALLRQIARQGTLALAHQ